MTKPRKAYDTILDSGLFHVFSDADRAKYVRVLAGLVKDRGTLQPWIAPLSELIEDGTVQPVVSDVVPFDRAADAHRIIAERRNVGKVILTP